jgi:hypothetical protein
MAIGKLIKGALRKAYQRNTAPLQAANRVARTIAPKSKIAAGLAAIASPGILNSEPSKKSTAPKKPKKETTDPTRKASTKKIKGRSAKGKVGKTRESDTSNFESLMPTMRVPGEDMGRMTSMPMRQRARRMKAGGLAVKGQGKAFLKSKR